MHLTSVPLFAELALRGWFPWWVALPLWLHMAAGSHIQWRGTRLRVLSGGLLQPLPLNGFAETAYTVAGLASE